MPTQHHTIFVSKHSEWGRQKPFQEKKNTKRDETRNLEERQSLLSEDLQRLRAEVGGRKHRRSFLGENSKSFNFH